MLQVQKDLGSWCSKHSLQITDLDAYSKILGFRPSEVQKHCAKIDMVRCRLKVYILKRTPNTANASLQTIRTS